jgi:TRAP-type C4-dicarboxylate transport system substrate-binding protein
MAGKIPKPSDIDAANISRPTVQQLSAEHQKTLDDIQKKVREEMEKEIQTLEEEAIKQYVSHFSINRQGKVTKDVTFDASRFEVNSTRINNLFLIQK